MLVGFGIVLLAAGAVLTFVIDVQGGDADLAVIGWILMMAGAGSILAGAIRGVGWTSSRTTEVDAEPHRSDEEHQSAGRLSR